MTKDNNNTEEYLADVHIINQSQHTYFNAWKLDLKPNASIDATEAKKCFSNTLDILKILLADQDKFDKIREEYRYSDDIEKYLGSWADDTIKVCGPGELCFQLIKFAPTKTLNSIEWDKNNELSLFSPFLSTSASWVNISLNLKQIQMGEEKDRLEKKIKSIENEMSEVMAEIDELGNLRCSYIMIAGNMMELNQKRKKLKLELDELKDTLRRKYYE